MHNDFPSAHDVFPPPGSKHPKLVPHLGFGRNYVVSGNNLNYYLSKGLVLEKMHEVLRYRQRAWLKECIEKNRKLRAQAKNECEKDFKLMNNAVYEQTFMDVTKFSNFELVNSPPRCNWLQRKYYMILNEILYSQCKKCQTFDTAMGSAAMHTPCLACDEDENCFVEIERVKPRVCLNRPMHVGFQILELSKLHMYKFWYDVLKAKYGDKIRLLVTDTDRFFLNIIVRM